MATLEQVVLEDIRSKILLVEADEEKAKAQFLRKCEQISSEEATKDRKRANQITRRLAELERLIVSAYEDKVVGRIPEDICVGLLNKYQDEKKRAAD